MRTKALSVSEANKYLLEKGFNSGHHHFDAENKWGINSIYIMEDEATGKSRLLFAKVENRKAEKGYNYKNMTTTEKKEIIEFLTNVAIKHTIQF